MLTEPLRSSQQLRAGSCPPSDQLATGCSEERGKVKRPEVQNKRHLPCFTRVPGAAGSRPELPRFNVSTAIASAEQLEDGKSQVLSSPFPFKKHVQVTQTAGTAGMATGTFAAFKINKNSS